MLKEFNYEIKHDKNGSHIYCNGEPARLEELYIRLNTYGELLNKYKEEQGDPIRLEKKEVGSLSATILVLLLTCRYNFLNTIEKEKYGS